MFRRVLLLALFLLLPLASARDKFQKANPVQLTRGGQKWAERTLRGLSLEEKIGQMFMLKAPAQFLNLESTEYLQLRDTIDRYHIGSFLLTVRSENGFVYRNQPYEAAMFTNQLQRESDLPLLFAADFERGLAMRFDGTTAFPHAMAFGAAGKAEYAEAFGNIVAQEARAIGVAWNFFPVADVNSNPSNPIINTRAFSEDGAQAGELAAAYIRAARQGGMLTTAKHFPGHGDTATDSHLELARVAGDRRRLEEVELPAFRRTIEAGVDAVMVAHITVPALDPDPKVVASTSRAVVTGLLKNQLHFDGLVVPDAMDMAAVTRLYPAANGGNPGRAAVDAVKAGNDMVLLPANLEASYRALLEAVRSGEIPLAQIDASVLKILRAKASVGLDRAHLVDIQALSRLVARPENLALAQRVAEDAITLVRHNGRVLPLRRQPAASPPGNNGTPAEAAAYETETAGGGLLTLILTDDLRSEYGRSLEREIRLRVPGAEILHADTRSAEAMTARVLEAAARASTVLAAVYVTPTSGKRVTVQGEVTNSVSLPDASAALLGHVLERASSKTVVVALGNPYLAAGFPRIENYLCTFSGVPVSEQAAVRALFGEIPIRGRLPVTVPNFARRGEGLSLPPAQPAPSAADTRRQQRNHPGGTVSHGNKAQFALPVH